MNSYTQCAGIVLYTVVLTLYHCWGTVLELDFELAMKDGHMIVHVDSFDWSDL